jgi:hypothetical protein
MQRISKTELARMSRSQVQKAIPFILTFDGEDYGVVSKPGTVIVTEDLHPAVQKQLKAKELLARSGM